MPSRASWHQVGLIAALLVVASACGGTSAEGTGSLTTGGTGGVTEEEARGGSSAEGTGAASSPDEETGGVTGAEEAGGGVFFPGHKADLPGVGYDGRIVEDGAGCLRFEISYDDPVTGGEDPTVVWPRTWSAQRAKEGRVRFFDEEGRAVGRTGEEYFLVGSFLPVENPLEEVTSVDEPTKRELRDRCPGGYYFTQDIEPPLPRRGETTSGQ